MSKSHLQSVSKSSSSLNSTRSEGQFLGFDKEKLYFQKWSHPKAKASLVITHGQAEHSGCYLRLVEALKELEIDIYAWDLRGHGKSAGLRGYAPHFSSYCEDFQLFLSLLTQQQNLMKNPIILLGHSMGGLIQAKTLSEHPQLPIAAQVLCSPMFGISVRVPEYKNLAATYLQQLLPKLTLGNEIDFKDLTRDMDVLSEFHKDVLRHDRISSGVYIGSKNAMSELRAKAGQIKSPTLMLIAENDPVTSSSAARDFFEKLTVADKKICAYADRKHELFNDLGREEVFADLIDFIKRFFH